MAEQRARSGTKDGGPQSCRPGDLSGERAVHARMQLLPEPVLDLGDNRASGNPGAQNLLTTDHAGLLGGNSMQARRNLASHAGEYAVLHRHFTSRDHFAALRSGDWPPRMNEKVKWDIAASWHGRPS